MKFTITATVAMLTIAISTTATRASRIALGGKGILELFLDRLIPNDDHFPALTVGP